MKFEEFKLCDEQRKKMHMDYPNVINESKEEHLQCMDHLIKASIAEAWLLIEKKEFIEKYG